MLSWNATLPEMKHATNDGSPEPDACSHRARSVRRSVEGQGHGRGTSASSVHQHDPWLHMQRSFSVVKQ